MPKMTLAELLEPRGVEAQLFPLLDEIGIAPGQYNRHRKEATDELVSKGYLMVPKESTYFRKAMAEMTELLEGLKPDQHILVPYGSPLLFGNETRLSKLPTHKVRRYDNLPADEKNKTLLMLTNELLKSVGIDGRVIGYDYMNSKGERNIVQLVDIIRAYEMMEDSYDPANVIDYSINKTPGKRYSPGMNAEVHNVPSADPAEPGKTYDVLLSHIVMADRRKARESGLDKDEAALTFNLRAKDHCCEKDHLLHTGYGRMTKTTDGLLVSDENLIDHHVIFAYLAYQRYISEEKPDKMVPDLFPKSSESFRDTYFWPLYNRALKEKADFMNGKITRLPLAMGEIEGLLWGVIGSLNERHKRKSR